MAGNGGRIGGHVAALAASVAGHGVVLAVIGGLSAQFEPAASMLPFGTDVDVSFSGDTDSVATTVSNEVAVVEPEAHPEPVTTLAAQSTARPSKTSARRAVPRSAPHVPAVPAPPHLGDGMGALAETGDVEVSPGPIGIDPGPMRAVGVGIAAVPSPPSTRGPAGTTPSATELAGAIAGLSLAQCFPNPMPDGTDRIVKVHVLYRGATGRPSFAAILNVPFAGSPEGACVVRELTRIAHVRPFGARDAQVTYDLRY